MGQEPYNPLDKVHLAESIARRMESGSLHDLGIMRGRTGEDRFSGVGIYALYYRGDFPSYRTNAPERPLYVGSALPKGGRTGGLAYESERQLRDRLREHANSIEAVGNLDLAHFACRYLVLDYIWVLLAENHLIDYYSPVWNFVVKGFGIHPPGGRRPQNRSRWDTLHPGRQFALRLPPNELDADEITRLVGRFYSGELEEQPEPSEAVVEAAAGALESESVPNAEGESTGQ